MSKKIPEPYSTSAENIYSALTSDYLRFLKSRGHSERTQQSYKSALKHFVSWFVKNQPGSEVIDVKTVHTFLKDHLPICHCPPPVFKELKTVRASLNQLLLMLGQKTLKSYTFGRSSEIESTLRRLDDFQRNVCGFAESTRLNHQRSIRRFLLALFGKGPIDPQSITSDTLTKFILSQAITLKPSSTGQILSTLRGYLRFLQFTGEANIALIGTVPRPPNWSLAPLPPSLSAAEMEKFWAVFDISTPIGKRDYAMARCLADLGLRCHEVTSLKIDDIIWRKGLLQLHHNKSRREDQLPLPVLTGRAIVDYLQNGRPSTTSRSVFVFHRAPIGRSVKCTTVTGAIGRAFYRAGISHTGTHILRHTAAARMIQSGVSLKEVADILRHRSIDTTQIYTKVNLPELKRVAMPWPGRSS